MKKLILFFVLLFIAAHAAAQSSFTLTNPIAVMGAGTPSRAFTITESGGSSSTNYTLSDGGAGGTFWPSSVNIPNTFTVGQFVYVPAPSAVGSVTITVSSSCCASQTITMFAGGVATVSASDNWSGSTGSLVVGRTPTVGAAWIQYNSPSSGMQERIDGSGGMYRNGTGHDSNGIAIPTNSAAAEFDVSTSVANYNATKTYPEISVIGSTAATLNNYRLIFVSGTGWELLKYVANSATTFWTDATHQQLTGGGSGTIRLSLRQLITGSTSSAAQYLFAEVNGVLIGTPTADSTWSSTRYPGFIEEIPAGQTPASTDSVYSNFLANNVDWVAPAMTVAPGNFYTGLSSFTLTLTGGSTSWTSSTTFTLSGGTGVTLTSKTNISGTSETLVVNSTSATPGIMTITGSDGSVGTVAVVAPFPVTNIYFSPYSWRSPGDGSMWAPTGGAYLKFSITGTTSIIANVDTSINSGLAATEMPTLKVVVNDLPAVFYQLGTSATSVTIASALTAGSTYTVVVYVIGGGSSSSGWSATSTQLRLTSLQFTAGATISAYPIVRSKKCFVVGDSFLAGYNGLTYTVGTTPYYSVVDPSMTWAIQMGYAMGCEVGVVGIGSQGYLQTGAYGYPDLQSSWDHYDSTHVRSFSPAPDYVINAEGINDHRSSFTAAAVQSAVSSWLSAARTALPSAKIFLYVPIGGQAADEDGTGGANATPIRNAFTAFADSNTFLIDTGTQLVTADNWSYNTWFSPNDSIHPAQTSHGILTGFAVQAMQKALGGSGTHAFVFSN